jgi:hypothetical protein
MRGRFAVQHVGLAAAAALALLMASILNLPQTFARGAPVDAGDSSCATNSGDHGDCILLHTKLHGQTQLWVDVYRTMDDLCNGRHVVYTATRTNSINVWIRKSEFTLFEVSSSGDTFDIRSVAHTAECPSGRLTYIPVEQNLCWDGFPLVATGSKCGWS